MIDLDANATTSVLPEVWEAMRSAPVGNPSSSHAIGRAARKSLEDARERIASLLGAMPKEVIVVSGATEANNLAVFGVVPEPRGAKVLASPMEHPCVLEPVKKLAEAGATVEWLKIDDCGHCLLPDSDRNWRLIALQLVNHETGAIQPVRVFAKQFPDSPLHCDAAQAVGKIPVNFRELGTATLSITGHKFGAPAGIGALLIREGHKLKPLSFGGHQQRGIRPGTEPVALAVGLAEALAIAERDRLMNAERIHRAVRAFLETLRIELGSQFVINGPDPIERSTLNLSFPGCRAELLLLALDLAGVACSTGSACSSGSLLPSPVLIAMGVSEERLQSALRFSFSSRIDESIAISAARIVAETVRRVQTPDGN